MTWKYEFDDETEQTTIYHDDVEIGQIDGKITEWIGMLPGGDTKEIVLNAVENPKTASLLYGFEEIREDEDEDEDEEEEE